MGCDMLARLRQVSSVTHAVEQSHHDKLDKVLSRLDVSSRLARFAWGVWLGIILAILWTALDRAEYSRRLHELETYGAAPTRARLDALQQRLDSISDRLTRIEVQQAEMYNYIRDKR